MLEHANYSLLLEGVSRSLTHELVRHRAGFAYSQLSQRYVDECEANFVVPPAIVGDEALEGAWRAQIESAQAAYVALVAQLMERYGWVADKVHRRKMAREAARARPANATETKIVVTANARAWRTMLELRSQRGRGAGDSPHGGRGAPRAPATKRRASSPTSRSIEADDRREAARIGVPQSLSDVDERRSARKLAARFRRRFAFSSLREKIIARKNRVLVFCARSIDGICLAPRVAESSARSHALTLRDRAARCAADDHTETG